MTVRELKEALKNVDDQVEVMVGMQRTSYAKYLPPSGHNDDFTFGRFSIR